MKLSNLKDFKIFLKNKKFEKVFLISGQESFKKSGAAKLIGDIFWGKKIYKYFKKSYYPEINEAKKIIYAIDSIKPNLILAIGGGSVIDYAKIANVCLMTENLKDIVEKGQFKLLKKKYPLAVLPTTAGSGAEVTSNAVLYINKKKFSLESQKLIPDYFFLLPELVLPANKNIKSSAGFDAIAQSIESIISVKANKKSIIFAKKSLELSFKNFNHFVNKPTLHNTHNMCLAANLSGQAINITKTTAPHALSYPFTAHFGISHGHAVSLTLNEFLKFNYEFMNHADPRLNLKRKFKIIFKLAKANNISELDFFLSNLKTKANLQQNFKKLNIDIEKNLNLLISGVNLLRLKNNPIVLNKHNIKRVLQDASKKK